MKKIFRWLGFAVAGVFGLALLALVVVYLMSWRELSRHYTVATQPALELPTDAASIAEGAHLAVVHGCLGCHGQQLQGGEVFDVPHLLRSVAPNISGAANRYTTEQLAAVLRQGIRPDGTAAWIMPAAAFRHLADADLARILAFVRSVSAHDGTHEVSDFRIGGRAIIAFGMLKSQPKQILEMPPEPPPGNPDDARDRGRRMVMSTCTECHGQRLEGSDLEQSPPLVIVKAYSPADFTKLMRTGVPLGGRTLGLMREVANSRFAHFTEQEIADVYAFLQSRPAN